MQPLEILAWMVFGFLCVLFLFLGFRGANRAKKKELASYGSSMFDLLLNPVLWDLATVEQKNILINKILVMIFTILGVWRNWFFVFVAILLVVNFDFILEKK